MTLLANKQRRALEESAVHVAVLVHDTESAIVRQIVDGTFHVVMIDLNRPLVRRTRNVLLVPLADVLSTTLVRQALGM